MKYVLIIAFLLLCACAYGQEEERSVLVHPPAVATPQPPTVQPPALPRQIIVFKRGLFGVWRAYPMTLVPVTPVIVQPRPTIIWTPQLIW